MYLPARAYISVKLYTRLAATWLSSHRPNYHVFYLQIFSPPQKKKKKTTLSSRISLSIIPLTESGRGGGSDSIRELLHPPFGQAEVKVRPFRLVVEVGEILVARWFCGLDLRALVPLVERRDRDEARAAVQRAAPRYLVVLAVATVTSVFSVPRADLAAENVHGGEIFFFFFCWKVESRKKGARV